MTRCLTRQMRAFVSLSHRTRNCSHAVIITMGRPSALFPAGSLGYNEVLRLNLGMKYFQPSTKRCPICAFTPREYHPVSQVKATPEELLRRTPIASRENYRSSPTVSISVCGTRSL